MMDSIEAKRKCSNGEDLHCRTSNIRNDSCESQDGFFDAQSGGFSPIAVNRYDEEYTYDNIFSLSRITQLRRGARDSLSSAASPATESNYVDDDDDENDEVDIAEEKGGYEDEYDDDSLPGSEGDEDDIDMPGTLENRKLLHAKEGEIEDNAKALAKDDPNRPESPPVPLLRPGQAVDIRSNTPWEGETECADVDGKRFYRTALEVGGYGHNVNRAWILQGAYQGLLELSIQEKTLKRVPCFEQSDITQEPEYPEGVEEPLVLIPSECDFPQSTWPILRFDAGFESGNLGKAELICHSPSEFRRNTFELLKRYNIRVNYHQEYDCWMRPDVNSKGNTQWFYFSVRGAIESQTVRFNIANNSKNDSLFNYGMRPVVFSKKECEKGGVGWHRAGVNVTYFRGIESSIFTPSGKKLKRQYYVASFEYTFRHSGDTVYFAYGRPYPYSRLCRLLRALCSDQSVRPFFRCRSLCKTLAGNYCYLATITAPTTCIEELKTRRAVILSARIHPGEACASWIMEGVLRFLTSQHPIARMLRKRLIFKVIPMLNPDGVIVGNYRCNLSGQDLNRQWYKPSALRHPTICAIKDTIRQVHLDRRIVAFIDLHGHSKRFNTFVYGCMHALAATERPKYRLRPYALAHLLDQHAEVLHSDHMQNYRKKFWDQQLSDVSDGMEIGETIRCSWDDSQWIQYLAQYGKTPVDSIHLTRPLSRNKVQALPLLYRIALRLPKQMKSVALLPAHTSRDWAASCLRMRKRSEIDASGNYVDDCYNDTIFPCVSDTLGRPGFRFEDCRFSVQQSKKATGRVCAWRDLQIEASYTLEASFMGTGSNQMMDARVKEVKYGKYGTVPVQVQDLPCSSSDIEANGFQISHMPSEETLSQSSSVEEDSEIDNSPMLEQFSGGSRTMAEAWYRLRRALDTLFSETGKARIDAAKERAEETNSANSDEDVDVFAHPLSWLCPSFRAEKDIESTISIPRKYSQEGPGGKYGKHYTAYDLIAQGESLCMCLLKFCSLPGDDDLEALWDVGTAKEVDGSLADESGSAAHRDCVVLGDFLQSESFPEPTADTSRCPSGFAFQHTLGRYFNDTPAKMPLHSWKGPPKLKRSEFIGTGGLYPPIKALDDGDIHYDDLIHQMAEQLKKKTSTNPVTNNDGPGNALSAVGESDYTNADEEALGLLSMLPGDSESSVGSDSDPSGDNLDEGELKRTNLFRRIISNRRKEESKRRERRQSQKSGKQKSSSKSSISRNVKSSNNTGKRSNRTRGNLMKSNSFSYRSSTGKPTHTSRRGNSERRNRMEAAADDSDTSTRSRLTSAVSIDDEYRGPRGSFSRENGDNTLYSDGGRTFGSPLKRTPFVSGDNGKDRSGEMEQKLSAETPPRVPGRFNRPVTSYRTASRISQFNVADSLSGGNLTETTVDNRLASGCVTKDLIVGGSEGIRRSNNIIYLRASSCGDMLNQNSASVTGNDSASSSPKLRKSRRKPSFPGLSIWTLSSDKQETAPPAGSSSNKRATSNGGTRQIRFDRRNSNNVESSYGNNLYPLPDGHEGNSDFLPNVQANQGQGASSLNHRIRTESSELVDSIEPNNPEPSPILVNASPASETESGSGRRTSPPLPSVRRGVSETVYSSRRLLLR